MIKDLIHRAKSSISQPVSQPEDKPETKPTAASPAKPKIEPAPIDNSPRGLAKAAAEAAGFVLGDQYQGTTSRNKPANAKLLWAAVDNWGEPVLFSVQNSADWSASERIWGHYAGPDAQGRLVFENRDGIRRNKFGRRR